MQSDSNIKRQTEIKKTFDIDEISLKLLNENTILIKDKNNETAKGMCVYHKIIFNKHFIIKT